MARYVAHIRSPKSPDEVHAYLSDLSKFPEWDPGIVDAERISEGAGVPSVVDLTVEMGPTTSTLRYRITELDPPRLVRARAENSLLTSVDTITIEPVGEGCTVTYEADLTLSGPLKVADSVLQKGFDKVGDRAADGLARALDGHRLDTPAAA